MPSTPAYVSYVSAGYGGSYTCRLAPPPYLRHHASMDTPTTPLVSPALEPEAMTALMLRYVEDNEEAAYQYARALVRRFIADLSTHDALRLACGITTETTNDIRNLEGEETASRIDVALRRLIDRVEAELTDRDARSRDNRTMR